jgi:hypothetical protein
MRCDGIGWEGKKPIIKDNERDIEARFIFIMVEAGIK